MALRFTVRAAVAFVLSSGLAVEAASATVTLSCPTEAVSPGSSFNSIVTIDVGARILGAYTITLTFDPAVAVITGVSGGQATEFSSAPIVNPATFVTGSTKVSAFNTTSLSSPSGAFSVATVTLQAASVTPIMSQIDIAIDGLFDTNGQVVPAAAVGCNVTVDSSTPTPTFTPTITPTRTSTQTPTPVATAVSLGLGNSGRGSFGLSSGRACLTATLASNGHSVASISNDVAFDQSNFTVETCVINPNLTAIGKSLSRAVLGPGAERISVNGGTTSIPDGVVYSCTVVIADSTPNGAYILGNTPSALNGSSALLPTSGVDGAIHVTDCAGDCDGDGRVRIAEVSRAAGLFLGDAMCNASNAHLSCPPADILFLDGMVSIAEVSKSACLFLSGTCSRTCN